MQRKGPPLGCPDLQETHIGPYLGHGQMGAGGLAAPAQSPAFSKELTHCQDSLFTSVSAVSLS